MTQSIASPAGIILLLAVARGRFKRSIQSAKNHQLLTPDTFNTTGVFKGSQYKARKQLTVASNTCLPTRRCCVNYAASYLRSLLAFDLALAISRSN